MAELMVYEKRTCTTCKNLAVLLGERGIDFNRVKRPVVVRGERAVPARPVERVLELLDD